MDSRTVTFLRDQHLALIGMSLPETARSRLVLYVHHVVQTGTISLDCGCCVVG